MKNGIMNAALADRGDGGACAAGRIPTGKWPVWSTTLSQTVDAAGNAELVFQAERDTLLFDLSVGTDSTSVDPKAGSGPTVNAEYCNTKYLVDSNARTWQTCCDRKPIFLVGVRDNKRLKFNLAGLVPDETATVTISGFQGTGCCEGGSLDADGIAGIALASGACSTGERIPTSAYPLFSQGFLRAIAIGATAPAVPIEFEAERDTLLTDLSVAVFDDVTGSNISNVARVNVTYCNTTYVEGTLANEFAFCCQRKPIFLVGVRENKRLPIDVSLIAAIADAASVAVEITGFQGRGCCA